MCLLSRLNCLIINNKAISRNRQQISIFVCSNCSFMLLITRFEGRELYSHFSQEISSVPKICLRKIGLNLLLTLSAMGHHPLSWGNHSNIFCSRTSFSYSLYFSCCISSPNEQRKCLLWIKTCMSLGSASPLRLLSFKINNLILFSPIVAVLFWILYSSVFLEGELPIFNWFPRGLTSACSKKNKMHKYSCINTYTS